MPGASEHPLYPGRARRRRVRPLRARRARRPRSRSASSAIAEAERLGVAHRRAGRAGARQRLFFRLQRGRGDRADGADDRRRRARPARPSLVAHAYYMRSVAQTSIGNPDRRHRVRGAVSAAAAIESGSPTALAQADYARGDRRSRPTDPDARARAVRPQRAARASRSATAGSAPSRSPRASGSAPSRAIRSAALAGYRDVIDTWFRGSDWANLWLSLRYVFAILAVARARRDRGDALRRARAAAAVMQALAAGAVERRRVRRSR